MIVNGFRFPDAFMQLCEAINRGEAPREWELRDQVDAYGNPWKNFGLILYSDPDCIAEETRDMDWRFREEQRLQQDEADRHQPGFIQDFTGVARFVQFGTSETGDTYCFDFGGDPSEPNVVAWEGLDCYWRRVAPNFTAFMELFVPLGEAPERSEEIPPLQPGDEGWETVQPTPPYILKYLAREYVLTSEESFRPQFFQLVDAYAKMSPEERREVEAEVREELEHRGMTDEQRRTHEELWARLQATHRSN